MSGQRKPHEYRRNDSRYRPQPWHETIPPINPSKVHVLAQKLTAIRQEIIDAGLVETYQAMDAVIKSLGWEAARKMERLNHD